MGILATGAMGLAAAAWWLRDPVLAGLSLGLLISVRGAWEVARALVRIRPRLTRDLGTPERALTIFRLLQEPEYWGTPATRRERLATSLFDRLDDAAAPAHTVLAGALLYLTFLVGVPLGVRASLRSEAPALWTAVAGIWQPRDGSRDQGEAGGGPSRPTISEASVVGR